MADACSFTAIIMRPVVIETQPGGVKKAGILVQLDNGPEKACILMRRDSSDGKAIPGVVDLVKQWQGEINQSDLLAELYRQDMVMHQLRQNFDVLVRRDVDGELISVGRFKYGTETETFLRGRREFLNSMEEAGDDGEALLRERMTHLANDGWTDNMVDPEMVVVARQLSRGRKPVMETTDAYGLAQDFNPDPEAIARAVELTKKYGYPKNRKKVRDASDEEIAEWILEEMHKELFQGNPQDSCTEIVLSGVRSVDEVRTIRKMMDDEGSWISREKGDLRNRVLEFEKALKKKDSSPAVDDFSDQLNSAETVEEMDMLAARLQDLQLGIDPHSVEGRELRTLIERKKGLTRELEGVVKDIKDDGFSFHHSAKVRPTKLDKEGFKGGLVTEMQIVKQNVHSQRFKITGLDERGRDREWWPNLKAHFGGCGVYYYIFGIRCK